MTLQRWLFVFSWLSRLCFDGACLRVSPVSQVTGSVGSGARWPVFSSIVTTVGGAGLVSEPEQTIITPLPVKNKHLVIMTSIVKYNWWLNLNKLLKIILFFPDELLILHGRLVSSCVCFWLKYLFQRMIEIQFEGYIFICNFWSWIKVKQKIGLTFPMPRWINEIKGK